MEGTEGEERGGVGGAEGRSGKRQGVICGGGKGAYGPERQEEVIFRAKGMGVHGLGAQVEG